MTRLRDRWWDILNNLPQGDPVLSNNMLPLEEHHGNMQDDVDDDTSVDDNASPVPLNTQYQSSFLSSMEQPPLASHWMDYPFPIHEAIRQNDEMALRTLLSTSSMPFHADRGLESRDDQGMSALALSVQLHRPQLLAILLQSTREHALTPHVIHKKHHNKGTKITPKHSMLRQALHMAVSNGNEECAVVFLDFNIASVLAKNDMTDDTPIHLACRSSAPIGILYQCLKRMDNAMTTKVMSQKNKKGQTPLHVACASGRVDLVEAFLTHCSYSLLSKVLSVQDAEWQTPLLAAVASGSVDVVMGLLMWKGNNHKRIQEGGAKGHCALSWAVRARNVEMTLLLLEFNDSSSSLLPSVSTTTTTTTHGSVNSTTANQGYNLVHSLYMAVRMMQQEMAPCDSVQLELIRVLVDAGANPYSKETPSGQCALVLATETALDSVVVQIMVTSYDAYLDTIQKARRRDPFLRKQPDSFFRGLEAQEEGTRVAAVREALLVALYRAWTTTEDASDGFIAIALTLLQRGHVKLDATSVDRLKHALQTVDRSYLVSESCFATKQMTLEASYQHPTKENPLDPLISSTTDGGKQSTTKRTRASKSDLKTGLLWSTAMTRSSWRPDKDYVSCEWLRSSVSGKDTTNNYPTTPKSDVELTSKEGDKFLAHSSIVCLKSGKLDAALRFERMSRECTDEFDDEEQNLVKLQLPVSSTVCQWVLQHFYHGAIVGPFPENNDQLLDSFFQLLDFAEQYLCPSLVQEVEMRILSARPRQCHCCHCSFRNETSLVENGMISCTYVTTGPSACIQPESALEVLAIALHYVEGDCMGSSGYELLVSTEEFTGPSWKAPDSTKFHVFRAMEHLRGVVAEYILQEFCLISESVIFDLHFESQDTKLTDDRDKQQRCESLLRTCLDILATSPILSSSSRSEDASNGRK